MIKQKIFNELVSLKGGVNVKGFEYTISAIAKVYNDSSIRTCELYNEIAAENSDTSSRVERAIRHYVSRLFVIADMEKLNKFNCYIDTNEHTPNNTEFIKAVALHLKYNNGEFNTENNDNGDVVNE